MGCIMETNFVKWMTYAVIVFFGSAIPGPAVLLATSHGMSYGIKKTLFSTLGNVVGITFLAICVAGLLGIILSTSTTLYNIVQSLGVIYFIVLGVFCIRSKKLPNAESTSDRKSKRLFVHGLLIALTNPKVIVFYTSIFPQFINRDYEVIPQCIVYALISGVFSFLWLTAYSILGVRANKFFRDSQKYNYCSTIAGVFFILSGLWFIAEIYQF